LPVTVSAVPSSLIIVILVIEALRSSEMSDRTGATQRNIPEDGILLTDISFLIFSFFYRAGVEPCSQLLKLFVHVLDQT
jgi:hypothetical protein